MWSYALTVLGDTVLWRRNAVNMSDMAYAIMGPSIMFNNMCTMSAMISGDVADLWRGRYRMSMDTAFSAFDTCSDVIAEVSIDARRKYVLIAPIWLEMDLGDFIVSAKYSIYAHMSVMEGMSYLNLIDLANVTYLVIAASRFLLVPGLYAAICLFIAFFTYLFSGFPIRKMNNSFYLNSGCTGRGCFLLEPG